MLTCLLQTFGSDRKAPCNLHQHLSLFSAVPLRLTWVCACMQLVASQTHRQDSSSIQLKLAAANDGQLLSPQQGLAELQHPHQQHVDESFCKHMETVVGKTSCCYRAICVSIFLHVLPAATVCKQGGAKFGTDLGRPHACKLPAVCLFAWDCSAQRAVLNTRASCSCCSVSYCMMLGGRASN